MILMHDNNDWQVDSRPLSMQACGAGRGEHAPYTGDDYEYTYALPRAGALVSAGAAARARQGDASTRTR